MRLPCGCNNFHSHSEPRLPRDRGISEEIELKDTSGYVISSAPPPPYPSCRLPFSPITPLFLKAVRHPVDVLREECAHREPQRGPHDGTKNISNDYRVAKIKIKIRLPLRIAEQQNRDYLKEQKRKLNISELC